jgi:AhpD family alkylhydroperoxidase
MNQPAPSSNKPGSNKEHVFIDKQHPVAWRALNGLGLKVREAAEEAGISRVLIDLLYIRISQLNGCAFCLDLHVGEALEHGETQQRIAVLPAWRDADLFSEQERAAFSLAESVTELNDAATREREETFAREYLSDQEFSAVAWLAVTMNAFNRVSIVSHHPVRRDNGD